MRAAQPLDGAGIVDHRGYLQAIANNAGIGKQSRDIRIAETGDPIDFVTSKCGAEGGALLQHRQPGQPGLIDLQYQPLEQHCLIFRRETVFRIVVRAVPGMARSKAAVGGAHVTSRES